MDKSYLERKRLADGSRLRALRASSGPKKKDRAEEEIHEDSLRCTGRRRITLDIGTHRRCMSTQKAQISCEYDDYDTSPCLIAWTESETCKVTDCASPGRISNVRVEGSV